MPILIRKINKKTSVNISYFHVSLYIEVHQEIKKQ